MNTARIYYHQLIQVVTYEVIVDHYTLYPLLIKISKHVNVVKTETIKPRPKPRPELSTPSIAVEISLLSYIQDEIYVISYTLPVKGCHL